MKYLLGLLMVGIIGCFTIAPQKVYAVSCVFGTDNGLGQCIGFLTAGETSWSVPSDWSDTNKVECVGSGGNGSNKGSSGGGGGGAGAYASRSNITGLTGTITVSVGTAGDTASTTFNASQGGKDVVCDWGRSVSGSSTGGKGGQAGGSIGGATFGGGDGGTSASSAGAGGGGGSGPSGAGGDGAASITGGSANNGTTAGPTVQGSVGNSGTEWDATHGSGSGGAGGSGGGNRDGGAGALYGGGGGGSNTGNSAVGGAGKAGLIIITYTPAVAGGGGDAAPARRLRLFSGFKVKIVAGNLKLLPVTLTSINTYYFNASLGGPNDPNTAWTNDANAFDGSTSAFANTSNIGSNSSSYLEGKGTTAPTSGGTISQVRARIYSGGGGSTSQLSYEIVTAGRAATLATVTGISENTEGYSSYTTLATPSGGWTWSAVNGLETRLWQSLSGPGPDTRVFRLEIEATSN